MARYSHQLLLQARTLAKHERQRPKQASLRRSVSASYYALFHFLIEETTRLFIGTAHGDAQFRHFAGRAFAHSKMKSACEEFTKSTPKNKLLKPWWAKLPITTTPEVITVAAAFVELQNLRHTADYDTGSIFSKQQAINAAERVRDAMNAWDHLRANQPDIAKLFALSLVLWPGLGER